MRNLGLAAVLVAAVTAAVAAAAGCAESPAEAFGTFSEAAIRGDRTAMLEGLTRAGRAALRGIIAASPESAALLAPEAPEAPGVLLQPVRVVSEAVREDTAVLEVLSGDGSVLPVHLVREDGVWRIDLLACERRWSRIRK